jgi:hypothetical protein
VVEDEDEERMKKRSKGNPGREDVTGVAEVAMGGGSWREMGGLTVAGDSDGGVPHRANMHPGKKEENGSTVMALVGKYIGRGTRSGASEAPLSLLRKNELASSQLHSVRHLKFTRLAQLHLLHLLIGEVELSQTHP